MRSPALVAVIAWALGVGPARAAPAEEPAAALAGRCLRLARTVKTITARGLDGFLFLDGELRHLAAGRFWGAAARRTGQAPDARRRDPLPAIVDYARRARASGRGLVFVPVPAKGIVYPDAIWPEAPRGADGAPRRLDPLHQEFVRLLAEAGVEVLDPTDLFLAARARGEGPIYCRQDSHYAPAGVALLARALAERVRREPWAAAWPRTELDSETRELTLEGDLWKMLKLETARPPERERLALRFVGRRDPAGLAPLADDPESPVLLLGDSHVLVFHVGGDMHAVGAGLPEQLGLELGFAVDTVAVRGSGGTNERLEVHKRAKKDPAWLERKRILLWVVATRELTRSRTGWSAEVPLEP